MKVTIDDIVKETGLSKSTISRAITNKGSVSAGARLEIDKAIRKLGYKAKHASLFGSKAVAVLSLDLSMSYSQATHVRYIQTLTRYFKELGCVVFTLDCCGSRSTMEYYLKNLTHSEFLGIFILSYIGYSDFSEDIRNSSCPIVLINHYPNTLNLDVVSIDNYTAGLIGGSHFIKNGHTDIMILSGTNESATSRNRIWGIREAYRENGLDIDDGNILSTDFTYDSGYEFALRFLRGDYSATGVFCMNSTLASGIIDAFVLGGKRIPQDLSIICSDYLPAPKKSGLALTTVCLDDVAIATAAADLMMERIRKPDAPKRNVVFSPILSEGNSVRDISKGK